MNGPNPVWTFATKKFSQSRPRALRSGGMRGYGLASGGWSGAAAGAGGPTIMAGLLRSV